MYIIGSIPHFECYIKKEYTRDHQDGFGDYLKAYVFGVKCIPGRALTFSAMFDNGAIYSNLPLSALCSKKHSDKVGVFLTDMWEVPSSDFTVHSYEYLVGTSGDIRRKDNKTIKAEYMFTIDYTNSSYANDPASKCAHIMNGDDGNYYAYPNTRILWDNPNFVFKKSIPDFKITTQVYKCEKGFRTGDDDKYFYDVINDNE
jgi:hypothetical protein